VAGQSAKMYKVCTKCGEDKAVSEYYSNRDRNGIPRLRSDCKVCVLESRKVFHQKHKDRLSAKNRKYYAQNKERLKAQQKTWRDTNRPIMLARNTKRRALKVNATPNWLTEEHNNEIQQFYWLAKDLQTITGETYHVDHIVPLKGENVCGLHVPWNLQVLPADINLSKGNKHADFTY
jgi:hypothetical protein